MGAESLTLLLAVLTILLAIIASFIAAQTLNYMRSRDFEVDTRNGWIEIHKAMLNLRVQREFIMVQQGLRGANVGGALPQIGQLVRDYTLASSQLLGQLDRLNDDSLILALATFLDGNKQTAQWQAQAYEKTFDDFIHKVAMKSRPTVASTETTQMFRRWSVVFALFVGFALCAAIAYFVLPHGHSSVSGKWRELVIDGSGFGWKSEALFNVDIPLPTVGKPHGQAKFLDWSEPGKKRIKLGYEARSLVDHLDASKIPAKYLQPRKEGNFEIDPIKEVVYLTHLTFTLKDADGFVLMSTQSEPLHLYSGKDNVFQGTAVEPIPLGVAQRTKTILMGLTADKCETCYQ